MSAFFGGLALAAVGLIIGVTPLAIAGGVVTGLWVLHEIWVAGRL